MKDELNCCCPPPKPPRPAPGHFPAMSAHFAHTLDDMSEQYLKAQYITVDESSGILNCKTLSTLLESRSNMVVYQNRIFRYSGKEDTIYNYLNLYIPEGETSYKGQQFRLNGSTGQYEIIDIDTGSGSSQKIEVLETEITDIQNNITQLTQNVTEITNQVTEVTQKIEQETADRKEAIERVIQDTTDSFNAIKEELEGIDEAIQSEISARETADADLKKGIESNSRDIETLEQGFETVDESLNTLKEDIDKNAEDIKSLEAGFETVDETLEQMDTSISEFKTEIEEKIEHIGDDIIMNGGEIE